MHTCGYMWRRMLRGKSFFSPLGSTLPTIGAAAFTASGRMSAVARTTSRVEMTLSRPPVRMRHAPLRPPLWKQARTHPSLTGKERALPRRGARLQEGGTLPARLTTRACVSECAGAAQSTPGEGERVCNKMHLVRDLPTQHGRGLHRWLRARVPMP